MTIIYCDCFSGISGDMFLGAMLDAGLPIEYLSKQFKQLNLPEFRGVTTEKVHKGAIAATLLQLNIHDSHEEHDHPLHHEHAHEEHSHPSHHEHAHEEHSHPLHHEHAHEEHSHPSHHEHAHNRHLSDIRNLIESSGLSQSVQQTSLGIFQKLAEAEAKVHGSSIEEVHFHEVGAVDSILDIVGAAIALDYFNIKSVFSSALPLGSGQVKTEHGLLPLPAPATTELLQMAQAQVIPSNARVELITPTGAAILASLAIFRQPEMKIKHVGIGAGQRDLEWPNILRVIIGAQLDNQDTHLEIETNIDDMNPQIFGAVMNNLFKAGALDVFFTPIYMKKNRPGTKLSVIASKEDEHSICDLLLRETSTLGVRVKLARRHEAEREIRQVETCYGALPVKIKILDGKPMQAAPEFDACVQLSEQTGVPINLILQEAAAMSQVFLKHLGEK